MRTPTATRLDIFDRSVEKANIWVNDVAAEMGTPDRHDAYRALRAYLHALRDRLPVNEAAQLSAQLPLLIRGLYFEGWQAGHTPLRYRDPREFLDRVSQEAMIEGETETSFAVSAAARVLARHVSRGEIESIARSLPDGLRRLVTG